jgi:hypothetical protein
VIKYIEAKEGEGDINGEIIKINKVNSGKK